MKHKILLLLLLPLLVIPVYAQEVSQVPEENNCSEAIETIKEMYEISIGRTARISPDTSNWFAAGLILGLHYVEKDCDTAKEKMGEILDALWKGQDDFGGQKGYISTDTSDKISTAIRTIQRML